MPNLNLHGFVADKKLIYRYDFGFPLRKTSHERILLKDIQLNFGLLSHSLFISLYVIS